MLLFEKFYPIQSLDLSLNLGGPIDFPTSYLAERSLFQAKKKKKLSARSSRDGQSTDVDLDPIKSYFRWFFPRPIRSLFFFSILALDGAPVLLTPGALFYLIRLDIAWEQRICFWF